MTDKPTPTTDLLKRCAEIYEWRSTGVLSGEALRDYAKRKWPDLHDTLQMAEHETVTEALALLAKWGQPAQAAEPVAVVVPCHTPSGKRVALCSAKQDLPIGTKLCAAPQPSPTAQAAPQPAPAPLSEMPYEKRKAIQEGEQISASDAWFHARFNMLDTLDRRNVFRAGFDRGWNAALSAQGGKDA